MNTLKFQKYQIILILNKRSKADKESFYEMEIVDNKKMCNY